VPHDVRIEAQRLEDRVDRHRRAIIGDRTNARRADLSGRPWLGPRRSSTGEIHRICGMVSFGATFRVADG
jgi:hypothetical protein